MLALRLVLGLRICLDRGKHRSSSKNTSDSIRSLIEPLKVKIPQERRPKNIPNDFSGRSLEEIFEPKRPSLIDKRFY